LDEVIGQGTDQLDRARIPVEAAKLIRQDDPTDREPGRDFSSAS